MEFSNTLQSDTNKPILIAGPCSAESREQVMDIASRLADIGIGVFRAGVWKPRTRPGCFEGYGEEALKWLTEVKKKYKLKIAVEVATPHHVEMACSYGIDIFWIGARTTTNPFAVQALADTFQGKSVPIMVKNPLNPDLGLWIGAIERFRDAGVEDIYAIHRGFSSYEQTQYRNSPMWQIPMDFRRRMPDVPIICDPSHIGGQRDLVFPLSQQALDLGFDGLMIECHCSPDQALSDASQQITPKLLDDIIEQLIVKDKSDVKEGLDLLRQQIDELDEELINLIAQRMQVSREIGEYKKEHNITVFQSGRYKTVLERLLAKAREKQIDEKCIRTIFESIHEESVREQLSIK